MSTRITINESKLLDYHDQMLDELYLLYHIHPTKIVDFHPSQAELAEMNEMQGHGLELSNKLEGKSPRKSKKVNFHSNSYTCNGLPRRR
jgi:hypothetical protein